MQICFEFIWKYAHCRMIAAAHYLTAGQPHTATRIQQASELMFKQAFD